MIDIYDSWKLIVITKTCGVAVIKLQVVSFPSIISFSLFLFSGSWLRPSQYYGPRVVFTPHKGRLSG